MYKRVSDEQLKDLEQRLSGFAADASPLAITCREIRTLRDERDALRKEVELLNCDGKHDGIDGVCNRCRTLSILQEQGEVNNG